MSRLGSEADPYCMAAFGNAGGRFNREQQCTKASKDRSQQQTWRCTKPPWLLVSCASRVAYSFHIFYNCIHSEKTVETNSNLKLLFFCTCTRCWQGHSKSTFVTKLKVGTNLRSTITLIMGAAIFPRVRWERPAACMKMKPSFLLADFSPLRQVVVKSWKLANVLRYVKSCYEHHRSLAHLERLR